MLRNYTKMIKIFKAYLDEVRKKGGLKLKLIAYSSFIIIITVTIFSTIMIVLTKSTVEKKSFEVATTSIERIADFSIHTLLERTDENEINLKELLKNMENTHIEGVLDISIYQHLKTEQTSKFKYLAGFKENQPDMNDKELTKKLLQLTSSKLFYVETPNTFRFVHPIIYTFQHKPLLLGVAILEYDKESIYAILNKMFTLSLQGSIVIIVIMIIFINIAGFRMTRPILLIADAATDVANGKFDIHLNIRTKDEIEDLASRFNDMVRGLRERENIQKFVSDSTMSMIQENSQQRLKLGGEYQKLTILFSDIRGFTAMSSLKKPDEVVEIINFYLNLQSEIIKKYHGDIDKFIGDEIMASFGGENGIDNALHCAIEIQDEICRVNELRLKDNLIACETGIGINYGEVVVGNIGSHERMDFTSIGSEVNLASRLCSIAKAGEIVVEWQTSALAKDTYRFTQKQELFLKGIDTAVAATTLRSENI
jgi:class 3 adenylate cyclase